MQVIIPWHGPLDSGLAITCILLISALVQYFSKAIPAQKCLNYGLYLLLFSLLVLGACMYLHWSFLFFVSDLLLGIGHGLALIGAFGLIHAMTNIQNRAAVMSTYLFVGYLGTILPIIAVGYLADHFGLTTAVLSFCAAICLLCGYIIIWYRQLQKRPVLG